MRKIFEIVFRASFKRVLSAFAFVCVRLRSFAFVARKIRRARARLRSFAKVRIVSVAVKTRLTVV